MHGGTLLKSVSAVRFSEKPNFWESVSFRREMFLCDEFFISPTHLYRQCDDFHETKNIDKHAQDQFLQPVKVHPCDKFGHVDKIMPCFFSSKPIRKW